MTTEKKKKN